MAHHLTPDDRVLPCSSPENCLYGSRTPHFTSDDSYAEGLRFFEKKMESQMFPNGVNDAENLSKRDLNQVAKFTNDPDTLDRIVREGSNVALRNLTKNPNAQSETLVAAYEKTDDKGTRDTLLFHNNFPAMAAPVDDFVRKYKKSNIWTGKRDMLAQDGWTDAHVQGLIDAGERANFSPVLENPNNNLSVDAALRFANRSYVEMAAAINGGHIPVNRFSDLDPRQKKQIPLDRVTDPIYLDHAVAELAQSDEHSAQFRIREAARNENTSGRTLKAIYDTGKADDVLYNNPNIHPAIRGGIIARNPDLQSQEKINTLSAEHGDIKELLVSRTDKRGKFTPLSGRCVTNTFLQVDTAKAKELGMTDDDIRVMLRSNTYNAAGQYDPETGIFHGAVDSSD